MNYGKEVQKAKAARSDHRKAKLPLVTSRRPKLDPSSFVTVERQHHPLGLFGASLGTIFFDSDGDGGSDTYGRRRRVGSVGGGLEIPTFGPIDPPASGPSDLNASQIAEAPTSGPSDLSASIAAPNSGPTSLVASEGLPDAPDAGPSDLSASIAAPSEGPSSLNASIVAPSEGPSSLNASIAAPASGPSGLNASEETVEAPASGPSSLVASIAAPASGPSSLVASVNAPVEGPSGVHAQLATLNIAPLLSDQSFADDSSSGETGEIRYSSDFEFLYIHNGSEWHRTDGGNS